jgi:hypothetical protein
MPRRVRVRLDLLPQVLDVGVDGALVAVVGVALQRLEQLEAREDAPWLRREGVQQIELRARERKRVAGQAATHLPPRGVHDHRSPGQRAVGRCSADGGAGRAAQVRPHASDQLARLERLGDVVVRAELESHHLVREVVARGEHHHRHVRLATDAAADVPPRERGQHHVQHDQRRVFLAELPQRGLAVGGRDDAEAVLLQIGAHDLHDLALVVDDEHGGRRTADAGGVRPPWSIAWCGGGHSDWRPAPTMRHTAPAGIGVLC